MPKHRFRCVDIQDTRTPLPEAVRNRQADNRTIKGES